MTLILSSHFRNNRSPRNGRSQSNLITAPDFSGALVPCTPITQTEIENSEIWMPHSFRHASELEKRMYCDGCGSIKVKNCINFIFAKKYIDLNYIYGLYIRPLCDIHDWQYQFGSSPIEKEFADRKLLSNLLKRIFACSARPSVKFLMRQRAYSYYEAVSFFADDAFYCNVPHPLLAK